MKTCICERDDPMACKAYRYGLDAGDAHGPCMCSCHSKKAHGSEAVEHRVQADAACACPRVKGEIYHVVGCPAIFYESLRR